MFLQDLVNRKVFKYTVLEFFLFFVIATLPLGNNLNSLAIIFFCMAGIFQNDWKNKRQFLKKNLLWVLPVLMFFIFLSSLIWDVNGLQGLKSIEKRASFLFFPLILASISPFRKGTLKTIFQIFTISVLIVCVVCLIKAIIEYLNTKDYRVFFYQYLSEQMHLNAIYLSLYLTFCLGILMYFYFINSEAFKLTPPPLAIFLYIFFSIFIVLLSSKMMIFISTAFTFSSVIYIAYKKGRLVKGFLFTLLIITTSIIVIWNLPYVRWRIQVTELKTYGDMSDDQNGLAVRQRLWATSIKLIKERPLLGYGAMNADERLVEEFKKSNFTIAAENGYDSHSVYLQTLLNTGFLGLIPLISLLLKSIQLAFKRRNYLFFTFIFTVIILGVTEAIFEGQKGIVFVMLFLFLFICHEDSKLGF